MPTNAEVAETFRGIADLLDVLGERFKPEAYRRAARSIESLTEELAALAARDELRSIPGVGDAIAEKIRELLATGHIGYYDRLRTEVPPGLVELLAIPGLGPKTARRFWTELGVEGPAELTAAIEAGRLEGRAGFGPRKIAQLRAALATTAGRSASARTPIEVAYPIARRLLAGLRASGTVLEAEIAGSFRRCRESVGDLDVLVTSNAPESVFDLFSALPEVREVRLRGGTKETVLLTNDLQVDLRVVEPAAYGAALLYFTGSKDHNIRLRSIARDRGLKINEYGVFRGEERVGGRTEEEVYRTLDLAWIPPELREDRGEIEAAAKGPLPPLVRAEDLVRDLHVHLDPDARPDAVDALVAAAKRARIGYVGCVVAGIDAAGARFTLPDATLARLAAAAKGSPALGRALEVGPTGIPPGPPWPPADYLIVRPVRGATAPPAQPPPGSLPASLFAHLGGTEVGRPWIGSARALGTAVEVGPGPERFDSTLARGAVESGVRLSVPTGVDRSEDDPTAPIALGFARRAGAGPGEVINAREPRRVSRRASAARSG